MIISPVKLAGTLGSLLIFFSLLFFFSATSYVRHFSSMDKKTRNSALVLWTAFIVFYVAASLRIGANGIQNELSIVGSARWNIHADAVLYAISQVLRGKTLLIDLPSQYGLYPELIRPIFSLINPSVFNLADSIVKSNSVAKVTGRKIDPKVIFNNICCKHCHF